MYEDAAKQLDVILELVKKCPDPLQERCLGILLQGYVDAEKAKQTGAGEKQPSRKATDYQVPPDTAVPAEVRPRMNSLAKRLAVEPAALEGLFYFTAEPFAYHPLNVPGDNVADKARNVALLVAARSFFATGTWSADWAEVKARCVDFNCYDVANHAASLRKAKGDLFKTVEVGKAIELSADGRAAAEKLLKSLAAPAPQS